MKILNQQNQIMFFSSERGERSLLILNNAIALLSRRGFVEEAEEYCIKAIDLIKNSLY